MNKLLISLFAMLIISMGCSEDASKNETGISTDLVNNPLSASKESDNKVIMTFQNTEYDFGEIIQGEKITYAYKFENTGNAPLIITSVGSSCGCTIPKWSKESIAPGESGVIDVVFDSDDKSGVQSKDITILSNAVPNTMVIRLTGKVIVP